MWCKCVGTKTMTKNNRLEQSLFLFFFLCVGWVGYYFHHKKKKIYFLPLPVFHYCNGCNLSIADFNSSNPVCLYSSVLELLRCPVNIWTTRKSFPDFNKLAITLWRIFKGWIRSCFGLSSPINRLIPCGFKAIPNFDNIKWLLVFIYTFSFTLFGIGKIG